jgi:2-C-methyl-D-erythritol 4-phosphate cytidylyltransferase
MVDGPAPRRQESGQRAVLRAIAGLDKRLDRIEAIAGRVETLEDWRLVSDGVRPGGLPVRVHDLEDNATEQRGAVKFLRGALALAVGVLGLLVYVLAIVRGGS